MAYRQTSGGYGSITNVTTFELTLLAQMLPGNIILANETKLEIAHHHYIERDILYLGSY
jgi:allophanate hydrolase subunit 2